MDAAGVIAYYLMDGNRPLTATTGSDTTSYLYGLGVIGEETDAWSYGLTDGTNTQRQLTDALGDVTYSARYTPWGDTLESYGSGNFAFGYFGGLMDAATGLLYVGDGQYYDPSTGRFLTRNARPNSPNPYLPFDPTGALFLPLALVSLVYGRKRRKSKWDILVIVTLLSLSAGMGVAACGGSSLPQGEATATVIATPGANYGVGTATFANGATQQALVAVTPTGTPVILVTKEIPCLEPATSTPTPPPASGNALSIYTSAGLKTQSPGLINTRHRSWVYALATLRGTDPRYSGIGLAKVTDATMEAPYGEKIPCPDNPNRVCGIGLGLRTGKCGNTCPEGQLDQDDDGVAYTAMQTRILLRTNKCLNRGCTATDEFFVAALAENESMSPSEVETALNQYKQSPPLETVKINWHNWLKLGDPNNLDYNLKLIKTFKNAVGSLSDLGVDEVYVNNLLKNP
jgi:RHS repeat-associated protein